MTYVYIFGDSITYGSDDTSGGWVQRIREQVDHRNTNEEDYWTLVYNLGVSGDTAEDILNRIDNELSARKTDEPSEKQVFYLLLE